jgi:NOL1/NOP2/fmu family ribosome biogenesis protein
LENEGSIGEFLTRHPEFFVLPVEKMPGMAPGRKEWCEYPVQGIEHTIRLWPHRLEGEGHYLAVLQKEGTLPPAASYPYRSGQKPAKNKDIQEFLQFQSAFLNRKEREENLFYFGEQLYRMPPQMPSLTGLKVLRPGLHLGTLKKNRFEPSHALALSLKPEEARYTLNLAADSPELKGYLTGQSFAASGEKGWTLILADGLGIGWGKFSGGTMKNHYPKGLRKYACKYACKNAAAGT